MIKPGEWAGVWARHLDGYLAKPPRTGLWMQAFFGGKAHSFLELGAGSGRDSLYLADQGHQVVATDQDAETLAILQARFADRGCTFRPADALALDFPDDSFDVVFHNGLWVLFEDDAQIERMLAEQLRVARKYAVIMVHNALNPTLVDSFVRRASADPIFDIRFFTPDGLRALVEGAGVDPARITLRKFGGRFDQLYRRTRIKKVVPNLVWPVRHKAVPWLQQLDPWSKVERVACIIECG